MSELNDAPILVVGASGGLDQAIARELDDDDVDEMLLLDYWPRPGSPPRPCPGCRPVGSWPGLTTPRT